MNKVFAVLIFSCSLQATALVPNQVLHTFGQQPNDYQSTIPYGNNTHAEHYVWSGDAQIYYEVYGSGAPVVILHGGLVGSMAEMSQFADRLKAERQVILINTRGHGKSDIGVVTPSYEQKAYDINAVLTALKLVNIDIIGFSDGAYAGYLFAIEYPEKLGKLVAIGAGEWQKGFRQFGGTLADFRQMDKTYWDEQMALRPQAEQTEQWLKQSLHYYNGFALNKGQLIKIQAPVLVMAGEKDANAPLDTIISAYKMLPNAQLAIIPNAPHPVFTVNFDAVWASLKPFLDEK